MKKLRLWSYKTGIKAGKLRQSSKDYLSFKLKEYWKTPEALERKIIEAPPLPPEKYIKVWAKWSYTGKKPLFIEAYAEGKESDEQEIRIRLQEFIASNFNEEIAEECEYGIETATGISSPTVNYKHSLQAIWQKL